MWKTTKIFSATSLIFKKTIVWAGPHLHHSVCDPSTCPVTHSVNHLAAASEASAGVWTSTASSYLAPTTAEGTFNVKTWRAATTTSERGRTTFKNPITTSHPLISTWPRAHASSLNHTCMLRPLFTLRFFFFFNWTKRKKKIQMKEQAGQKTQIFFSFLFCFIDQALIFKWGGNRYLDSFLTGPLVWAGFPDCRSMKIYAHYRYIFL